MKGKKDPGRKTVRERSSEPPPVMSYVALPEKGSTKKLERRGFFVRNCAQLLSSAGRGLPMRNKIAFFEEAFLFLACEKEREYSSDHSSGVS